MNAASSPPEAPEDRRRVSGPRVVLFGIVLVVLITSFVVIRIVQVSGPGPDPSTLPERPAATTP